MWQWELGPQGKGEPVGMDGEKEAGPAICVYCWKATCKAQLNKIGVTPNLLFFS